MPVAQLPMPHAVPVPVPVPVLVLVAPLPLRPIATTVLITHSNYLTTTRPEYFPYPKLYTGCLRARDTMRARMESHGQLPFFHDLRCPVCLSVNRGRRCSYQAQAGSWQPSG